MLGFLNRGGLGHVQHTAINLQYAKSFKKRGMSIIMGIDICFFQHCDGTISWGIQYTHSIELSNCHSVQAKRDTESRKTLDAGSSPA
jgi:hypothetical protein